MTIIDTKTGLEVPGNKMPFGAPSSSQWTQQAGDLQVICVKGVTSLVVQTDDPTLLVIEKSLQDCMIDDPSTENTCNCPDDYVFNPLAIWTSCGNPPSGAFTINTEAVSAVSFVSTGDVSISIAASDEFVGSGCFGCDLCEILSEENPVNDVQIFQDAGNDGFNFYGVWDEITMSWTYFDFTDSPYTPVQPSPVLDREYESSKTCLEVVVAGAWGALGEKITKITYFEINGNTIGEVLINQATGANVTATPPSATDAIACVDQIDNKSAYSEQLINYDPITKECTEFTRHWVYDSATGTKLFNDETHAGSVFTASGDVFHFPKRYNLGGETIAYTDGAVFTPAAIPPFADLAEVSVWGGAISYEKEAGVAAPTATSGFHRIGDAQVFELEGRDEIEAFSFIGLAGQSGVVQVRYKKGLPKNN